MQNVGEKGCVNCLKSRKQSSTTSLRETRARNRGKVTRHRNQIYHTLSLQCGTFVLVEEVHLLLSIVTSQPFSIAHDKAVSNAMAAVATQNTATTSDQAESSTSAAASAAVYQRLYPDSYLSRYLAKNHRPDGRKIRQWRDASINTGQFDPKISDGL